MSRNVRYASPPRARIMSSRICLAFFTPGSLAAVAANCAVGQAAGAAAGGTGEWSCAPAKAVNIRAKATIDEIRMDGCDCNPLLQRRPAHEDLFDLVGRHPIQSIADANRSEER